MKETPTCGVVIITFNYGQYLEEALRSVLAQTRRADEVIVVDDGSTNQTRQVVQEIPGRFPGVKVLMQERHGQAHARNVGVKTLTSDYILCLDGDDRLKPNAIQDLAQALDQDSQVDFAYGWSEKFGAERGVDRFPTWDPTRLIFCSFVQPSTCLFRRTMWKKTKGWGEELLRRGGWEDWDYFIRAAAVGAQGRMIPKLVVDYRRHSGADMPRMSALDTTLHAALYRRYFWFFLSWIDRIGGLHKDVQALTGFRTERQQPLDLKIIAAVERVNTLRSMISAASQRVVALQTFHQKSQALKAEQFQLESELRAFSRLAKNSKSV